MKLTHLLGILIGLAAVVRAEVTVQGPPNETREFLSQNQSQVTLKGHATTTVEATEIKVQVALFADGVSQAAVLSSHEEQKQNFLGRLQALGIARGDVVVPKFATITPRYAASGAPVIGYHAESVLSAEVKDQKQYLDLVSLVDRLHESRIDGLTYGHSQLSNLQKQILIGACKHVMARKETYEQTLGVTLRPISFTEEEAPGANKDSDGFRFGQITITATVQIVFKIEPGAPPAPKPEPGAAKN